MSNDLAALTQRQEKFERERAAERSLYDRALEIERIARTASATQRHSLRVQIAEVRQQLLVQDQYLFDRKWHGDFKTDLETQAATLSIKGQTRDAISSQLGLAEQTLYSADRADEVRQNLSLVRRTLWVSGMTLIAAAASVGFAVWDETHRAPQSANDLAAQAIAHSIDPKCTNPTDDPAINMAFMEGCPGFRGGKFDPDKYLEDVIASGAHK